MSRANLTRGEAHDIIADCGHDTVQLSHLAAHWDVPGHWNESAEWTADFFHEYVDSCAESMQDRRASGRNPKDSDRTGLTAP